MRFLELRIPPPLIFLAFALLMAGVAQLVPEAGILMGGRYLPAAILASAGTTVGLAAMWSFRCHKTSSSPLHPEKCSALVTSGIYRYSRNPMYLGLLLFLGSWALWLGNLASFLCLPLFMTFVGRCQIHPEERILAARFGEAFAAYRKRVRRWL